jgi:hypothetical protein
MNNSSHLNLLGESPIPKVKGLGLNYSKTFEEEIINSFNSSPKTPINLKQAKTLIANYLEVSNYTELFIYSELFEIDQFPSSSSQQVKAISVNDKIQPNSPLLILDSFESFYTNFQPKENQNLLKAFQLQLFYALPDEGLPCQRLFESICSLLETYAKVHFYLEGDFSIFISKIFRFIRSDLPGFVFNYESPQLHSLDQKWISWNPLASGHSWKNDSFWYPNKNEALVVLHEKSLWRKSYRWCTKIANLSLSKMPLIYPFLPTAIKSPLDNPTPSVIWAFVYGGAGRIWPTINGMANLLERPQIWFHDDNCRGLKNNSFDDLVEVRQTKLEKTIETLDDYKCLMFHHGYYKLDSLREYDIKLLMLTRDPRDIYTSRCFRALGRFDEEFIIDLMLQGDFHVLPNLDQLLDQYLIVEESSNMKAISFEKINKNPLKAYLEALDWLGWTPSNFNSTESVQQKLTELIESALPKNQSLTDINRGAIRLGKSGGWAELWSPKMSALFSKIGGSRLTKLNI